MDHLLGYVADNSDARLGGGDSFTDQLNARYTVIVLTVFIIMVMAKYYVNEPISCWCPAHFESSHCDFANKVSSKHMHALSKTFK